MCDSRVSRLLTLPAELRLSIYDFVLDPIPLTEPHSAYNGLLYSCTLLHSELQKEILTRMTNFLLDLQRELRKHHVDDLEFEHPQSYAEVLNLTVSRPNASDLFRESDPFLRQMPGLRFSTLTIKTFIRDPSTQPEITTTSWDKPKYQRNAFRLTVFFGRYIGRTRAKTIVYDWSVQPEEKSEFLNDISIRVLTRKAAPWTRRVLYAESTERISMGVRFERKWMGKSRFSPHVWRPSCLRCVRRRFLLPLK